MKLMYLTRMELDTGKRNTMIALGSPQKLHGAIESSFDSSERKRKLWRIDRLGDRTYLLLLSEDKPDLSAAVAQFGVSGVENGFETRDYSRLLERIENGGVWRFKLTANPTISTSEKCKSGERGNVKAHISDKYQVKWLLDRAEKHGFAIDENELCVTGVKWYIFRKGAERNRVSILSVTYEGILKVTDKDKFCNTLINGIGREKAYGLGMLTVVKG